MECGKPAPVFEVYEGSVTAKAAAGLPRSKKAGQMKTILIVDDEPAARYGLCKVLEENFRFGEGDSAEAAREGWPREQPVSVLLNLGLPGRDGFSCLRWMRERGR